MEISNQLLEYIKDARHNVMGIHKHIDKSEDEFQKLHHFVLKTLMYLDKCLEKTREK